MDRKKDKKAKLEEALRKNLRKEKFFKEKNKKINKCQCNQISG